MAKIGLVVGREWSFPPAFIEEVNRRNDGVTAPTEQVAGRDRLCGSARLS